MKYPGGMIGLEKIEIMADCVYETIITFCDDRTLLDAVTNCDRVDCCVDVVTNCDDINLLTMRSQFVT